MANLPLKNRKSDRLVGLESGRILDEGTRQKRLEKQLAALERDNVQEDPHTNVSWHKAAPTFSDDFIVDGSNRKTTKRKSHVMNDRIVAVSTKKGGKLRAELSKTRFRKNFQQLNEEFEQSLPPNYTSPLYNQVTAAPSRYPKRKFCDVCGTFSKYRCMRCSVFFCSVECNSVHEETRCMRWTH